MEPKKPIAKQLVENNNVADSIDGVVANSITPVATSNQGTIYSTSDSRQPTQQNKYSDLPRGQSYHPGGSYWGA